MSPDDDAEDEADDDDDEELLDEAGAGVEGSTTVIFCGADLRSLSELEHPTMPK